MANYSGSPYTTGHPLITDAIDRFQQSHYASTATKREQLGLVKGDIRDNAAAVDRYLIAFEKGTLDDDAPEIRVPLTALKNQPKALRARKAELEIDLEQPPEAPTPADLDAMRAEIRLILTNQTHNDRKALFEALIQEINITADDTVRPVFKIPVAGTATGQTLTA